MANTFIFANLARSSLAGSINNVVTSLSVQAGAGALFPNPSAGQQFAITLTDAATGLLKEVMYCTARSGDTMTVVRGQESYTALSWSANDPVANLWTAGQAASMAQQAQLQAQASNYTTDIGAANAYVGAYSPSISVPVVGMPLRLKITNTNSGPSTFNPGSGLASIVTASGSQLTGGELQAGLIYEFMWNGTRYELMAPTRSSISAGQITANASSVTPPGWLICNHASYLRADYPDLFTAISTTYGAADGSHFNVPDLNGRTIAGLDPTGTRLTATSMSPNGNTLAATGGGQTNTAITAVGGLVARNTNTAITVAQGFVSTMDGPNATTDNIDQTGGASAGGTTHTHANVGLSGGLITVTMDAANATSGAFVIVQPTMLMYWIIRAYN